MTIQIREALEEDTAALSALMTELGYPTSPAQMQVRFKSIALQSGYKTLIAEAGGKIMGMIGVCIGYYYENDGVYLRLLALVTTEEARNKGIASALLEAAEAWGKKQGALSIVLNSGNRAAREAAHAFYLKRGFEAKSTGFVKKLH